MDFLAKIESLYDELPSVECLCCGTCCVSPTCTLTEFVYLINFAVDHLGKEKATELILRPPSIHPNYEGNLHCIFLNDSKCTVHHGRTGACRLFGISELSELKIDDFVECKNKVSTTGNSSIEFIKDWLRRLSTLNEAVYPFSKEPYFLRGLNLSCWFDLYFDESIMFEPFSNIKNFLHDNLDLTFIRNYKLCTGIKEKIDKITLFSLMLDSGDSEPLKKLILSIRDEYPLTGTYFYEEANEYLKVLTQGDHLGG